MGGGVRVGAKGAWVVDWRTWFKVESRLMVVDAKEGTRKRFMV